VSCGDDGFVRSEGPRRLWRIYVGDALHFSKRHDQKGTEPQ
jgi:hypothetical protein